MATRPATELTLTMQTERRASMPGKTALMPWRQLCGAFRRQARFLQESRRFGEDKVGIEFGHRRERERLASYSNL
jgi:hypothetical protein